VTKPPALVAIPAHNEERSIGEVVRSALSTGLPVLVVDDGSSDGTGRIADDCGATVLRLPINLGVGGARRAAYRYAVLNGFRCVAECDADGQHPIGIVPNLVSQAELLGVDMLIGSRFTEGRDPSIEPSALRRLAMGHLARSASRATGSRLTDATSGFRVVREPLLSALADGLPAHYLGDTYEAIVAAGRSGYRISETPIAMSPRQHGTSTASPIQAATFVIRATLSSGLRLHPRLEPSPAVGKR